MCERWINSFENFFEDMGQKPHEAVSIDRINPNGDYTPENCRWATCSQQANNLRTTRFFTVEGVTDTITGFANRWGCSRDAIKLRLRRGQTIENIAQAMLSKRAV